MHALISKRLERGLEGTGLTAAVAETSLGPISLVASDEGIHRIEFGARESQLLRDLVDGYPGASLTIGSKVERWLAAIVEQIASPQHQHRLPLAPLGTPFQQRVWEALCATELGATLSYAELAQRIGKPTAARAVASACAANQIAVLIPCHRVLRNDGGLGGYRWGVQRKRTLLQREAWATQSV